MSRVTAVSAAGASPITVTLQDTTGAIANANLACLGSWNEITYAVNPATGNLDRTAVVNGVHATTTTPSVVGVVNLQAQYGIAASANSNQVTQWVDASGGTWAAPTVANRNRIKAIRVAVVARNAKIEPDVVTAACSSTTAAAPTGLCAWDGTSALARAGSRPEPGRRELGALPLPGVRNHHPLAQRDLGQGHAMTSPSLNSASRMPFAPLRIARQRGVALFFALICMVAIMLAAVALVRSVDTAALISGNLAFQQSATASGDAGTEAAITWLAAIEAANSAMNVLIDPAHPFNANNAAAGYYASLDPAKSLTAQQRHAISTGTTPTAWCSPPTAAATPPATSIQRMCRTAGVAVKDASCLFSGAALDNNKQNIPLPQEICKGDGCPVAGQTPMLRVTSAHHGPEKHPQLRASLHLLGRSHET